MTDSGRDPDHLFDIAEVRIVTPAGTYHRGFMDRNGELYTNEKDNLDQSESRQVAPYLGPDRDWSTEGELRALPDGVVLDHCRRCFPAVGGEPES